MRDNLFTEWEGGEGEFVNCVRGRICSLHDMENYLLTGWERECVKWNEEKTRASNLRRSSVFEQKVGISQVQWEYTYSIDKLCGCVMTMSRVFFQTLKRRPVIKHIARVTPSTHNSSNHQHHSNTKVRFIVQYDTVWTSLKTKHTRENTAHGFSVHGTFLERIRKSQNVTGTPGTTGSERVTVTFLSPWHPLHVHGTIDRPILLTRSV